MSNPATRTTRKEQLRTGAVAFGALLALVIGAKGVALIKIQGAQENARVRALATEIMVGGRQNPLLAELKASTAVSRGDGGHRPAAFERLAMAWRTERHNRDHDPQVTAATTRVITEALDTIEKAHPLDEHTAALARNPWHATLTGAPLSVLRLGDAPVILLAAVVAGLIVSVIAAVLVTIIWVPWMMIVTGDRSWPEQRS